MMRKALYESRLPPTFWLEALQWATYTYNRLPLSHRKDEKSPYELRYKKRPDIMHLRPFGVRGSVTLTAPVSVIIISSVYNYHPCEYSDIFTYDYPNYYVP